MSLKKNLLAYKIVVGGLKNGYNKKISDVLFADIIFHARNNDYECNATLFKTG